jgi:hypothetical protein
MSADPTTTKIMQEIYEAVERLDGPLGLLAAIGSYGDTLTPDEVLTMLEAWNENERKKNAQ